MSFVVGKRGSVSVAGHNLKPGIDLLIVFAGIEGCNGRLADCAKMHVEEVVDYYGGWRSVEDALRYKTKKMTDGKPTETQMVYGKIERFTRGKAPEDKVMMMVRESGLPYVEKYGYEAGGHNFLVQWAAS